MLQQDARWIGLTNEGNEDISINEVVDSLLAARGLVDKASQEAFLNPSLDQLESPDTLNQMDLAYERITRAIANNEQIIIYGDYDADGITSTALLYKALQKLGAAASYYIPDRFTEGYGLNNGAIQFLYDEGYRLIITVDNGIASVDQVAYAKELGFDVIITDHHELQEALPQADAIIHPKLSADYEWKELAGVGIAFQLATKLLGEVDQTLLDLVAIGTIADMVPLLSENRIFAHFGLKQMGQTKHIGLRKLMEHCQMESPIQTDDIGFKIGPRLNAVGRLDDAEHAVRLLVTDDESEAEEIVMYLEELNKERQQLVTNIVKEAEEMLHAELTDGVIMLYSETWHEGVLGIAASRIAKKYHRPTFMFAYREDAGILKGSARSIEAFDLFETCMLIQEDFIAFGGHAQAAGMTIQLDRLDAIRAFLNEQLEEQCTDADFIPQIHISASIPLEVATEEFVKSIQQFAPFGMGNEKPLFHVNGIAQSTRTIGQNNQHLKIQLSNSKQTIDCIGFQKGKKSLLIGRQDRLDLVGHLQINEWNGTRTVQLLVEDMCIKARQIFDFRGTKQRLSLVDVLEHYQTHIIYMENIDQIPIRHEKLLYVTEADIEKVQEVDVLYLFDLPRTIQQIERLFQSTKPKVIFLCYEMNVNSFYEQIPSRKEFKQLYQHLLQTEAILVTERIKAIIQQTKWKQEKVVFMIQVLLELDFLYLEDRVLQVSNNPNKQPLETAPAYMEKLAEQKRVTLFYQDRFDQLSQWIKETIDLTDQKQVLKEEISNGL